MLQQLTKLKLKKTNLLAPMLMIFLLCLIFTSTLLVQGMALVADNDTDDTDDTDETGESEEEDDDKTDDKEDDDEDDDGIDDDEEEANERDVNFVDIEANMVKFESELEIGDKKDEITVEFDIEDEPKFELEYESESDTNEIELEFSVKFYGLIEYIDSNLDGIYNESDDQLVQEMEFDSMEFLPIEYTTQMTGTSTTIHIFNATTKNGIFTIRFYVVGEFTLIDGTLITPTQIKIDIGIHNFPYKNDSSVLALEIKLESETEYEEKDETEDEKEGYASDEKAAETTMNDFTGFFSWSGQALVDNQSQPVNTSPVEDDDIDPNKQKLYLNYPHGIHIVHDPKIGVAGVLQIPGIYSEIVSNLLAIFELSKEEYLGTVAAFTLLVMSAVVLYRRKQQKNVIVGNNRKMLSSETTEK